MNVFKIKRTKCNEDYIRSSLNYFINKKREKVSIYFDDNYIRIVVNEYYNSLCNTLLYLLKNNEIIATPRSLKWLQKYKDM